MRICGIDEAGRGPIAGPVTAAAVILPIGFAIDILDDSKKLSEKARNRAFRALHRLRAGVGIGWAWPEEIDRMNIHRATLLAMRRAFKELIFTDATPACRVVVDGRFAPDFGASDGERIPQDRIEALIGGDTRVPEIMAASIVAKVCRDAWMRRYGWIEPEYGYERHKGYPTVEHRRACRRIGPSPIQRRTFAVREVTQIVT